jgi:hypothetical protein
MTQPDRGQDDRDDDRGQTKSTPVFWASTHVTLPSECVSLSRLVLGDVVIPVAVVAVGMWESA